MSQPFLGEVKVVPFNFAPKGWALCNGQLLAINQNQALFSLLSTTYGGDGQSNFAVPNLQGRVALHRGSGFNQGSVGGENAHVLSLAEMPTHAHTPTASTGAATTALPPSNVLGTSAFNLYATQAPDTTLQPQTVGGAGVNAPHENRQPFLVLNFVIALSGIYPSRP